MAHFNRKHFVCKICGKKHYAKEYCRYHHTVYLSGGYFSYPRCKVCGKKVVRYREEELCSRHMKEWVRKSKPPRYAGNGGDKWGYKDYRMLKHKKKDRCQLCGSSYDLQIHHRDHNPRNSSLENIVTLCRKCHFSFHRKKKTTSKYIRLYGKTLSDLAREKGVSLHYMVKFMRESEEE
jgi:5-methylcytosine-specific restriction endonuclease McrA